MIFFSFFFFAIQLSKSIEVKIWKPTMLTNVLFESQVCSRKIFESKRFVTIGDLRTWRMGKHSGPYEYL